MRRTDGRQPARAGFTLTELLFVMVIVGIIIAFILNAALSGVRRAEERATQSLIAKLEAGVSDRLESLLGQRATPNAAHGYLAALFKTPPNAAWPPIFYEDTRAQVIAQVDLAKAEIPDVFVVQGPPAAGVGANYYPLNFAAGGYGGTPSPAYGGGAAAQHAAYFLPLGVSITNDPANSSFGDNKVFAGGGSDVPAPTGAYGASFSVLGGFNKQLAEEAIRLGGTPPTPPTRGYDGADNDGDGMTDELDEQGALATIIATQLLPKHTHKTARSEALYALLVEGQGPLGSVFTRDEFTDAEVRDTDGDGLLEFVDAWGEPLQFYRWPFFHSSDVQRGAGAYSTVLETRDQNPLDPNQQLLAPAWWVGPPNTGFNSDNPWQSAAQSPLSGSATNFQRLFFQLVDPNARPNFNPTTGTVWDRGSPASPTFARRAFYSRFLILSGGPDKTPGVPVLDSDVYLRLADYSSALYAAINSLPAVAAGGVSSTLGPGPLRLVQIESQAGPYSPIRTADAYMAIDPSDALSAAVGLALGEASADDITSHNLQSAGGATR